MNLEREIIDKLSKNCLFRGKNIFSIEDIENVITILCNFFEDLFLIYSGN